MTDPNLKIKLSLDTGRNVKLAYSTKFDSIPFNVVEEGKQFFDDLILALEKLVVQEMNKYVNVNQGTLPDT